MKSIVFATALFFSATAVQVHAAEEAVLSPAAMEQLALAEKLIALGRANNDPLLLIAAAQIRNTVSDEPVGLPDERTPQAALLDEAKSLARDRQDLIGIADDIAAARSKGCSVRYGCQNPYLN
jgi:hypothetical protein